MNICWMCWACQREVKPNLFVDILLFSLLLALLPDQLGRADPGGVHIGVLLLLPLFHLAHSSFPLAGAMATILTNGENYSSVSPRSSCYSFVRVFLKCFFVTEVCTTTHL